MNQLLALQSQLIINSDNNVATTTDLIPPKTACEYRVLEETELNSFEHEDHNARLPSAFIERHIQPD
ncbi:hypothetical protein KIN20_005120 [Parelaphostrongylus tenuis]|uniref:Uncharacterized protein n=1 Tax=Parelaphostrongylus tenuis TaxID=148309 RepID=A0AAD5MKQ9_PARTN|nr:hypothetical protein KIN20_005120 [Parelaphostrongylus tenuis]